MRCLSYGYLTLLTILVVVCFGIIISFNKDMLLKPLGGASAIITTGLALWWVVSLLVFVFADKCDSWNLWGKNKDPYSTRRVKDNIPRSTDFE